MVSLVLLPAVSLVMPKWHLPVLPKTFPVLQEAPGQISGVQVSPAKAKETAVFPTGSSRLEEGVEARSGEQVQGGMRETVPWAVWTMLIWLVCALLVLARPLVGLVAVGGMSRKARVPNKGRWQELMREVKNTLRMNRDIRLLESGASTMPMAWGILKPTILLPQEWTTWTDEKRRFVLLHETAHVKRLDFLTHLTAGLACAFHWFNPLAWIGLRKLRLERERACDDLVLAAGARPSDYANHLLEFARGTQSGSWAGAVALTMARPSQLEGRMLAILDGTRARGSLTRGPIVSASLIVMVILLIFGTAQVTSQKGAPEEITPEFFSTILSAQKSYFQSIRSIEFTTHEIVNDLTPADGTKIDLPFTNVVQISLSGRRFRQHSTKYFTGVAETDEVTFDGSLYMRDRPADKLITISRYWDRPYDPIGTNQLVLPFYFARFNGHEFSFRAMKEESFWDPELYDIIDIRRTEREAEPVVSVTFSAKTPTGEPVIVEAVFLERYGYYPIETTFRRPTTGSEAGEGLRVTTLEYQSFEDQGNRILLPLKVNQLGEDGQTRLDIDYVIASPESIRLNETIPEDRFRLDLERPGYKIYDSDSKLFSGQTATQDTGGMRESSSGGAMMDSTQEVPLDRLWLGSAGGISISRELIYTSAMIQTPSYQRTFDNRHIALFTQMVTAGSIRGVVSYVEFKTSDDASLALNTARSQEGTSPNKFVQRGRYIIWMKANDGEAALDEFAKTVMAEIDSK